METKSVRRKLDNSGTLDRIPNSTAWSSWGPSTPPELLYQVLRYLVPGAPHYSLGGVELEYVRQRSYFAQLRLVCTVWDGPVLFKTILLFMKGSDGDTLRNLRTLDYHSNLIKSLVIVTKRLGGVDIPRFGFENKIDETLGFCSKLRELTFADGDFTFLNRRWPQKTCPGLASTVTSLKLVYVSRKTCSLTLVGLGHNLTSLEITFKPAWSRSRPGEEPIHMPSNLPHLSQLMWTHYSDCDDNYPLILKFASRIVDVTNARIPGSKRSSPLRCRLNP